MAKKTWIWKGKKMCYHNGKVMSYARYLASVKANTKKKKRKYSQKTLNKAKMMELDMAQMKYGF